MANWLVTVDYDDFELDKAFEALPVIYWKNKGDNDNVGFQQNDIVYVYVAGKKYGKVQYQFKVISQANSSDYPPTQRAYWKNKEEINSYFGKFSILEKLCKLDKPSLSRAFFIQNQFISKDNTLQGRRTDRGKGENNPIKLLLDHISQQFNTEIIETNYPDEANLESLFFPEGAKKTVQVNRYERNPEARAKCIEIHGTRCKICDMSFEETYGTFAKDFIHVHHKKALHEISEEYEVDPINDLIPVCPNCHAMLHRQENGIAMKVDRLKLLFEVSKTHNSR